MTLQEQNTGTIAAQEWLNCNALGSTYAGWTRTGFSPRSYKSYIPQIVSIPHQMVRKWVGFIVII